MSAPRRPSALATVRDCIARVAAGDATPLDAQLGAITLRPHQLDALRRVRAALQEFGGALLADEPGLGKTFVALAAARDHLHALTAGHRDSDVLIAAPAALRELWRESAARARVAVRFVSLESLSRRDAPGRATFMVIDEAHHACNPATARYPRAARAAKSAQLLLLSATPVRNRAAERTAMLALFCGPRAATLTSGELARCVIRRGVGAATVPRVVGPKWQRLGRDDSVHELIGAALDALPPPLPLESGLAAAELVTQSLVRCWASSLAAFATALRRRVQRGAALRAILAERRLPTRHALRAWVVGDDAMQLAFPLLVPGNDADTRPLLRALTAHMDAVQAILNQVAPLVAGDTARRARFLARLQRDMPGTRIVAFTSHATTAAALYAALHRLSGMAMLTANGARTASGPRPRADVLRALAGDDGDDGDATRADRIALVIATDVLSEGVNLQGASVIVHLDLPWTPAGLEQRVGRAVRIGSPHAEVRVYGVAPPRVAQRMLGLEALLARKREASRAATEPARVHEELIAALATWRSADVHTARSEVPAVVGTVVASVRARRCGALAAVRLNDAMRVLAVRAARVSDDPGDLLAMVQLATDQAAPVNHTQRASTQRALARWIEARHAERNSGTVNGQSPAMRLLFTRLRTLLDSASPHERGVLAERIGALRNALARTSNAGTEIMVRDIATRTAPTREDWLLYAERAVVKPLFAAGNRTAESDSQIVALLLLNDR